MKVSPFLLLVVAACVVAGIPGAQCRRFGGLPQKNGLGWGNKVEEYSKGLFRDPLTFDSVTRSTDEDFFKADITIRNGVIRGLSTFYSSYRLTHPFGLRSFRSSSPSLLYLAAGVDYLEIICDYEVPNGYLNLPSLGEHTFSGHGLFHLSLAGVSFQSALRADPNTGAVSFVSDLTKLSISGVSYFAENYAVDGELFDEWTELNEVLPGLVRVSWEAIRELVVDEMNKQIEGLTLADITRLLDSRQQQQPRSFSKTSSFM